MDKSMKKKTTDCDSTILDGIFRVILVSLLAAGMAVTGFAQSDMDDEEVEELPTFVIDEAKDVGYMSPETYSASRAAIGFLDLPMAVDVINREKIDDTSAFTLSDAVRASSNVHDSVNESHRYTVRGFDATVTLNGVQFHSENNFDLINIERVEIAKGPSAVLFPSSGASPGGVINIITKRPHPVRSGLIRGVIGKFNAQRLEYDLNTPLDADGRFLFRITGAYQPDAERWYEGSHPLRHTSVAPSFTWNVTDFIKFSVRHEFMDSVEPHYNGNIPYYSDGNVQGNRIGTTTSKPHFFGGPRTNPQGPESFKSKKGHDIHVDLNYKVTDWLGGTIGYYNEYRTHWRAPLRQQGINAQGMVARNLFNFQWLFPIERFYKDVIAKVKTGPVKHSLFFGYESNEQRQKRYGFPLCGFVGGIEAFSVNPGFPDVQTVNPNVGGGVHSPCRGYSFDVVSLRNGTPPPLSVNPHSALGAVHYNLPRSSHDTSPANDGGWSFTNWKRYYVRDIVSVWDERVAGSVGYTRAFLERSDGQTSWDTLWNLGIVVRPLKDISLYYANNENLNPSFGREGERDPENPNQVRFDANGNPVIIGQIPPPTNANNEVGVKAMLFDNRVSARVSYFNIDLENRAQGLTGCGCSALIGAGTSKGVEVEVQGSYRDSLIYSVSLAKLNVENEDGSQARFPGYSDTTYQFWGKYRFPEHTGLNRLSVMGGVMGASEKVINTGETLPSYALLDLGLIYEISPSWELQLNVRNATDAVWHRGGHGNQVSFGDGRNIVLRITHHLFRN